MTGQTLDFLLNETRCTRAAKRFFRKVLGGPTRKDPRVINVDLKQAGLLPVYCERRPVKYLNNIVEQDHRFIKRRVQPGLGFGAYPTAWRTRQGYEVLHMIRKGQIDGVEQGDSPAQNQFIAGLFGLVA